MSLRAMVWVMEDAPVDPNHMSLLIALADRASDDGTAAWPSQAWLADRTRLSVRTVKRRLSDLEAAGLIRRGDQQLIAHLRPDRRPVVWDIDMTKQRGDKLTPRDEGPPVTPREVERGAIPGKDGGPSQVTRGDNSGNHGGTLLAYKPSLEPSMNHPMNQTPYSPPDLFDEFWSAYPLKKSKPVARTAWAKAIKKAPAAEILTAVPAYVAECDRTGTFMKNPATWLNQECWTDEPAPVMAPSQRPSGMDLRRTEGAATLVEMEKYAGMTARDKAIAIAFPENHPHQGELL